MVLMEMEGWSLSQRRTKTLFVSWVPAARNLIIFVCAEICLILYYFYIDVINKRL